MKIINRYIVATLIKSTLVVLIVLLGMDIFIQFLNEMDDIGQGNYTVLAALSVAMLRMPQSAYQFFPMAGLIGSLMGLGTLASNSELIVMRSAGIATSKIISYVILAAVLIMGIVTILGEGIAPYSLALADQRKALAISEGQAISTNQGAWIRYQNNFIHVDRVLSHTHLQGIRWYTLKGQQIVTIGVAGAAVYNNQRWQLSDVNETIFNGMQQTQAINKKHMLWDMQLNPKVLKLASNSPDEMSLLQLSRYIHYRQQNNLQASQYDLNFWQRLLQPAATLVMIFLAVPFIFGPLRSVPMGLRILAGIGMGLLFYFSNQLFGPFSMVYQLPPFLAAIIPIIVFATIGFLLMWRAK